LLAASGARGWTADGSGAPPPPLSLVQTLRWRAQALDDTARQVPAAAAVLSCRVDGRRLATMVELEDEAVVAALDLPLAIVVGHVLDLYRRDVTVVFTVDPAGGAVVTLIG
jgi:hypothetical protein